MKEETCMQTVSTLECAANSCVGHSRKMYTKPRGLSPRANYTDRAAAAGRRS